MNLFAYTLNSPTNFVDPLGFKTCVLVTRVRFGFADHAALYIERGDSGKPALYDPSGSYARAVGEGWGDLLPGDKWGQSKIIFNLTPTPFILKLNQLERVVNKAGGKIRVDLEGVKGTGVRPHAHVEGLGSKIESRHIWLD
ncbi:MAG: hypothetical protein D3910_11950 [Candidatus Electrothrix sp. ATG2]|nr:hypothetical protein [Candidatus Electrothrix sp. ATG2]